MGIQAAHKLGSASLLDSVRAAYVHGLDVMLWVCGGIALACALLALAFLPRRPAPAGGAGGEAGAVPPGTAAAGVPAGERAELGR